MQQQKQTAFAVFIDDEIALDEIDRLFSRLQPIEPPPSFIPRLLDQIQSQPVAAVLLSQSMALDKLDTWLIQNEKRNLC